MGNGAKPANTEKSGVAPRITRAARKAANQAAWKAQNTHKAATISPEVERRTLVRMLVAKGIEPIIIAARIDMELAAFEALFAKDLTLADEMLEAEMSAALFINGVYHNSFNAQALWLKARHGWREAKPEDGNTRTSITLNISGLRNGQITMTVEDKVVPKTLPPPEPQVLDLQGVEQP